MLSMCTCLFTLQFLREGCTEKILKYTVLIRHVQGDGQPIIFLKSITHKESKGSA